MLGLLSLSTELLAKSTPTFASLQLDRPRCRSRNWQGLFMKDELFAAMADGVQLTCYEWRKTAIRLDTTLAGLALEEYLAIYGSPRKLIVVEKV